MLNDSDAPCGAFRSGCLARRASLMVIGLLASSAFAANSTQIVSVYSKTANDYARTRLPDNSYKPETYTFAPGGRLEGLVRDSSIDRLTFYQVAAVVAQTLKVDNYQPTGDARKADLIIFLSWGTTTGAEQGRFRSGLSNIGELWPRAMGPADLDGVPQIVGLHDPTGLDVNKNLKDSAAAQLDNTYNLIAMMNQQRERNNWYNAGILGYRTELRDAYFLRPYSPLAIDVIGEVEENRYFVVLQAYDFQDLWKHHEKTLRWETRFSIRQHGNRFDQQLPFMAKFASQFYGQNIGKLIRRPVPTGRVDVGAPVVVPEAN